MAQKAIVTPTSVVQAVSHAPPVSVSYSLEVRGPQRYTRTAFEFSVAPDCSGAGPEGKST